MCIPEAGWSRPSATSASSSRWAASACPPTIRRRAPTAGTSSSGSNEEQPARCGRIRGVAWSSIERMTSMKRIVMAAMAAVALVGVGFAAGATMERADRVFEMRTYITNPGKMPALHARFRDHTTKMFAKHGMENVGYWSPTTGDNAENTLVYILAYPSKEAREKSWKEFVADPDWIKAKAESEKDGV